MSDLKFHEEEYLSSRSIQTKVRSDSFGLSTFLIKRGVVKDIRAAKRLSNLIMIVAVIVSFILIIIINVSSNIESIDEKYYYDPTQTD